ncbi:hypothetical protein FB451DRAFT_140446 [Mycena latifolia]|nr:hypothetical protein FB451DRAFT_140446 [Mycena latifolia]
MRARIFCHDSPEFPPPGAPAPSGPPTLSVIATRPAATDIPHHPSPIPHHPSGLPHHSSGIPHHPHSHHPWAHCEIIPDESFNAAQGAGKKDLAGAVLFGALLGLLFCVIPLIMLLRKVRRLRKRRGLHGFHGGPRWKFTGQLEGAHQGHGPHRGFPEYEAEHLLKHEYEAAPLDY